MDFWEGEDLKQCVSELEGAMGVSMLHELIQRAVTIHLAHAVVDIEQPPMAAWVRAMQNISQPKPKENSYGSREKNS